MCQCALSTGGSARSAQADDHSAADAVPTDIADGHGGDQAQVHRHSIQVWARALPDQRGEAQVPGPPQGLACPRAAQQSCVMSRPCVRQCGAALACVTFMFAGHFEQGRLQSLQGPHAVACKQKKCVVKRRTSSYQAGQQIHEVTNIAYISGASMPSGWLAAHSWSTAVAVDIFCSMDMLRQGTSSGLDMKQLISAVSG